jgi:hypothetical protein
MLEQRPIFDAQQCPVRSALAGRRPVVLLQPIAIGGV